MAADAESLRVEIEAAGKRLGEDMSRALPFKRSGVFARMLGAHQVSKRITVPGANEGEFTRAWLERKGASTEGGSPIELRTDTVTVDPERATQAAQYGKEPGVAASYDLAEGLELRHHLGASQEVTLARIHELGLHVAAIAKAELDAELVEAIPVHDRNFAAVPS